MYGDRCNKKKCYATAYVNLQDYRNLYTVKEALMYGTIFKDLYSSYSIKCKSNDKRVVEYE